MSRLKSARATRGLVLIELVMIVVILGIIAAIAIMTFRGQRTEAQDSAAQSSLRNALSSARAAAGNNDSVYPPGVVALVNASEGDITVTTSPSNGPTEVGMYLLDDHSIILTSLSDSNVCWYIYDDLRGGTYYGRDNDGLVNGCDPDNNEVDGVSVGVDPSAPGTYHATDNEIAGGDFHSATVVDPTS